MNFGKQAKWEHMKRFQTSPRQFQALIFAAVVGLSSIADGFDQLASISPTERTKIHSGYFGGQHGEIDRRLADSPGDIEFELEPPLHERSRTIDARTLATEIVCGSKAIVVATPKTSHSVVSAFRQTIFTEWTLSAEEVMRGPARRSLPYRSHLVILTNGGSAVVGTRRVTVVNTEIPLLVPTRQYLFFLYEVQKTDAFVPWFVLDVSGERLMAGRKGAYPNIEKTDTQEFLSMLRSEFIPASIASGNCQLEMDVIGR